MTLARDPNIDDDPLKTWMWAGYENVTAVTNDTFTFTDTARAAKWRSALANDAATGGDMWLHGYWKFDWRDTYVRVKSIEAASSSSGVQAEAEAGAQQFTVTRDAKTPSQYPWVKGCRFYATNSLALLDVPGEYFVSSEGLLYVSQSTICL